MKLLFIVSSLIAVTCFFSWGIERPQSVSSAPVRNGDWRLYTPPDKSFSVEFPCDPAQTSVSASSPTSEYSCHLEEADSLRIFMISVWKADFEGAKIHDEAAFERSVKESFTPNHRIVKIIPIQIDGGIGREVIVTNTRDEMDNLRGRVIIFGNHRFEVGYFATDMKRLESAEADRFFAGFKPLR